jgi:YidC/Oxa1 family membrane protein insertase
MRGGSWRTAWALGTRLGLGKDALGRKSAETLCLKEAEANVAYQAFLVHKPNFGTWTAAPKDVRSLGQLKKGKKDIGVGFENARRRALGASFLLPRGIHNSTDEDKSSIASQDAVSDLSSSLGDVTTLVESSIRDVELSLIANSGYWWPVESTFNFLYYLHNSFDLSWVGAVALGTFLVRVGLAPLSVEQMKAAERMAVAKPELDRLTQEAKAAVSAGTDGTKYTAEMQKVWKKHGIHPARSLGINLVNLPVMLLLPYSIINLPKLGMPSLQAESFLWINDISAADPYYALPLACSAMLFGSIHFNMSPEAMTPEMQKILPVFKLLPIVFLPVTMQLASIFHIFALTSIVVQTGQTAALKNGSVRKLLGFSATAPVAAATPATTVIRTSTPTPTVVPPPKPAEIKPAVVTPVKQQKASGSAAGSTTQASKATKKNKKRGKGKKRRNK